jgi:hypothetical protein
VRLFDLLNGRVYDQRELTIAINNAPPGQPSIQSFTSSSTSVDATELANRTARVPVSWAVDNRPANSNLIFEQVLPGGSVVNVELPRTVPIVPSSGNGVAAPILPQGAQTITLTLRLVNLSNNETIQQREIILPIRGQASTGVTVTDAAPASPEIVSFAADVENAQAGDTVTVTWEVRNASHVTLRAALTGSDASDFVGEELPLSGSQAITIPENVAAGSTGHIYLYVYTEPNTPAAATGTITLGLT